MNEILSKKRCIEYEVSIFIVDCIMNKFKKSKFDVLAGSALSRDLPYRNVSASRLGYKLHPLRSFTNVTPKICVEDDRR